MSTTTVGTQRLHKGDKYVRIKVGRMHPLANQNGWVNLHRLICWKSYGANDQACHWCGWVLPWRKRELNGRGYLHCINVDHLDGDRFNNHPDNLVPACWWCNANRHWQPIAPDEYANLVNQYRLVHPAVRPNGIAWLAVEWGIGTADLFEAIKAELSKEGAA